jgi:hypothetical protein
MPSPFAEPTENIRSGSPTLNYSAEGGTKSQDLSSGALRFDLAAKISQGV